MERKIFFNSIKLHGQTEIKTHYINKGNKWYIAKRWELWCPKRVKVFDIIGSPSALTVEQGKLLYNEIINILKDEEIVIVDFTNIESIIMLFLEGSNRKFNMVIKNAKNFYANKDLKRKKYGWNLFWKNT